MILFAKSLEKRKRPLAAAIWLALCLPAVAAAGDLTIWYDKPGVSVVPPDRQFDDYKGKTPSIINEGLPVGNGRLGALVLGGTTRERIALNEISLWTGDENPSGEDKSMGDYQALGDLFLTLAPGVRVATDQPYRRSLDLATAVARTEFAVDGGGVLRETFASAPAQVLVTRWSATRPGAVSGTVELAGAHGETTAVNGATLSFTGRLANGMEYEAAARVIAKGGRGRVSGGKVVLENCDEVVVLVSAGTSYAMDYAKHYRGENPHARVMAALAAAARKPYETLKAEHVADHRRFLDRVNLDLGASSAEQKAMPFDQRVPAAAATVDPELEALLFQYGRYLLISCSRPGGLPANLQGMWNESNNPPWNSDYHANINVEMNYWPAEVTNLSEFHLPFFNLIQSQLPSWRKLTADSPEYRLPGGRTRGFALRTSHNITGGMGWKWDKTANAWYCLHFWEHYAFTGDRNFLKNAVYPILKETCQFWEDHLKALPDGKLVVPDGWSPEHGGHEDGVSYNQQIVWELFNNYVATCDVLGMDRQYRDKIAGLRDRLLGPRIGRWGQLQEWMEDKDDPENRHRHTSHLFAVYPGRQIGMARTPLLAEAARVSLAARDKKQPGDKEGASEWARAWRTALWARLHDGDRAHFQIQDLFSKLCLNLFGAGPMQVDGNLGVTAGIAEMLVQSHEGEIDLLPALPGAWPAGSAKGLRARGGFEVDIEWKDGALARAVVHSQVGGVLKLRLKDKRIETPISVGQSLVFDGSLNRIESAIPGQTL